MKTLVAQIKQGIENNGGIHNFPSSIRKNRPVGCPMKRSLSHELQSLTNEEIHVAFHLGLIGNENRTGQIV